MLSAVLRRSVSRLTSTMVMLAIALTTVGFVTVSTAAPAAAAPALRCDADNLYVVRANGQVMLVAGDTGVITNSAIYDGASGSEANQLGIGPGGLFAVNTDNDSNSITIRNIVANTQTSVTKANNSGTVAGAINPRTNVFYYGGFSSESNNQRTLSLYGYNLNSNASIGLVAQITVPNTPGNNFSGGNGDIAFSATGGLYIISSSSGTSRLYRYQTALPTTTVSNSQTGSASQISTISVSDAINGIAYGGNGFLYISSASNIIKVDSSNGSVVQTRSLSLSSGGSLSASIPTDLASCATPSTVTVKVSFPDGRNAAGDQATVSAVGTTGTTTGSEVGVQDQSDAEYVGPVPVLPNTSYSVTSGGSGGTNINNYVPTYICTNDATGATVQQGSGASFNLTTPSGTTDVTCVVSYARSLPSIGLTKSASPSTVTAAGQVVTYTFAVSNTGNRPLDDISLVDPMPQLSAVVCAPVALGSTLAVGASTTCTATYTVRPSDLTGTQFQNTATITGTAPQIGTIPPTQVSNTSTATVTVNTAPPVATDDNASTTPGVPVPLAGATNDYPSVTGGPAIVPGSTILTSGSATASGKDLTTSEGTWHVNADGTVTFTPASGFTGTTAAVTYRITDTAGKTDTATLTVLVQPGPSAAPDTATTPQNVNVNVTPLANDSAGKNANGTEATFAAGSLVFPTSGQPGTVSAAGKTLTVSGEGVYTISGTTVTFDPEPGFRGAASAVRYEATNSLGVTVNSTITITVTPINPTATNDAKNTAFNTSVVLEGITNDTEGAATAPLNPSSVLFPSTGQPSGSVLNAAGTTISVPNQGVYVVYPDGTVYFVPASGFVGTTTPVTYLMADANGTTATATLTVTVRTGPAATPDTNTTPQNVTVDTNVLSNDTPGLEASGAAGSFNDSSLVLTAGPPGSSITGAGKTLTVPGEGVYTVLSGGTVSFDPEPQFVGNAGAVTYRVADSNGNTVSSTLTLTVTPIRPTATDDSAITTYNDAVDLDGATDDTAGAASAPIDVTSVVFPTSGQPSGVVVAANGKSIAVPQEGTYVVNADGTVTFTPNDFNGITTPVTYQVADSNGTTDTAELTVTVRRGPNAVADTNTTPQNINVTTDVLANDTPSVPLNLDPGAFDVSSVVFATSGQPSGASRSGDGKSLTTSEGVYTVENDGRITFDPAPLFSGTAAAVTYEATDTVGKTVSSTLTITVTPIAPSATNDAKGTTFNQPVDLEGATNDTEGAASAPIDVTSVIFPVSGQPSGTTVAGGGKSATVTGEGTFSVNPDGTVTFAPAPGFTGTTASVVYSVADTNGTTDTATLTVTVQVGASAAPDTNTTLQNVDVTTDVLDNDTPGLLANGGAGSFDAASVVFTSNGLTTLTVANEGTYSVNADGTITFDPMPAFVGVAASVGYSVTDSNGQTVSSTLTITVTPIAPDAANDTATTELNNAVDVTVLGNDNPGDASAPLDVASVVFPAAGQPVGATVTSGGTVLTVPGEGSYSASLAGVVTFTPETGFTGPVTAVTYQVSDSNGASDTATITITILPGPDADDDNNTTLQDINVTTDVLANDTPSELVGGVNATWDVTSVVFASTGTATVTVAGEGTYTAHADGTVTFDPEPSFTGTAAGVVYTVTDSIGNTASATLTITVTPILPTANDDSQNTPFNTPATLTGATDDTPGDASAPIDVTSVVFPDDATQPAGSTIAVGGKSITVDGEGTYVANADGTVTFTPVTGFVGVTSHVTYQVADDNGSTDTAELWVTVRTGPEAVDDTATTEQNVDVTISQLGNDTPGPIASGAAGSWAAGSVVFTDDGQPAGAIVSTDHKTLTVGGEGVYSVVDDEVVFNPTATFVGATSAITYEVTDSFGNPASAKIRITVTPVLPHAQNDQDETTFNHAVTTDVAVNDLPGRADAPILPGTVVLSASGQPDDATPTAAGTQLVIPGEGTYDVVAGGIRFTPEPTFTGSATGVSYDVQDANGTTTSALLTVVVRPGPVAVNDDTTTDQNVNVTLPVLGNDTPGQTASGTPGTFQTGSVIFTATGQPTGATVTADGKSITVPDEGSYTVNAGGTVTFDPEPSFVGDTSAIAYRVTDAVNNTASALITVHVLAITPSALPDTEATEFNTPVTVDVLDNDSEGAASAPLDATSVVFPATGQPGVVSNGGKKLTVDGEGVYDVQADGTVDFTPAATFSGTATPVTYEVSDSNGTPVTATITVTVQPGPSATGDSGSTPQDITVTFPILGNDVPGLNANGTPSTLVNGSVLFSNDTTTITVAGEGIYTSNGDGTVTFDPEPTFVGTTTPVSYSVADAIGNRASAQITVTVSAINPTAVNDEGQTPFQTPVTVDVLDNDSEGDASAPLVPSSVVFPSSGQPGTVTAGGKTLTITNVGVFTVETDGSVTFTPAAGFVGATPAITYQVSDDNGTPASAQVVVTVRPGPTSIFDADGTKQDVNVTVDVLDNDTPGVNGDGAPGAFDATSVVLPGDVKSYTVPGEGTYTVNADGTVTFDPVPSFTGAATPVLYTVTDSHGNTSSAEIRITVAGIDPLAVDDSAQTPFNTAVALEGMTNDLEGDASAPLVASLTVFPASGQPAGAIITNGGKAIEIPGEGIYSILGDGSVLFNPATNYSGTTTAAQYRIEDENGTTDIGELQVDVRPGPTADDDSATTAQNVNVTISVLTGDVPGPNANNTAGSFDVTSVEFSNGTGTITVAGEGTYTANADGTVTFDPAPSFTGATTPVRYWVTDSHGNTANALIRVTVNAIKPAAANDSANTPFNTPVDVDVVANDTAGAASAPIDAASVVFPASGTSTLTVAGEGTYAAAADGTVTFTPEAGFSGAATSVTYSVADTNGTRVEALISITVRPGPTADPEVATTPQNVTVGIDVRDGDVPGLNANGTAGSFVLGSVVFTVGQANGTVSPDGKTLTIDTVGVFSVVGERVEFDPEPAFVGTVPTVTYDITDSHGNTASATIDVTVTAVTPGAADNSAETAYGTPVTFDVVGNDTEGAPSAPLNPASVVFTESGTNQLTIPGVGSFVAHTDGTVTFTPAAGFEGVVPATEYSIADANGTRATADLNVVVRPGPVPMPDSDVTPQNVPVTLPVLDNDTPSVYADGSAGEWDETSVVFVAALQPLAAAVVPAAQPLGAIVTPDGKTLTMPGEGVYQVNPDGTVTFTPEPQFIGATSTIEYQVTDRVGNAVITTIDITIVPGGEVEPDVDTAIAGTPKTVVVLTNDTAPSGLAWNPASVRFRVDGALVESTEILREGTWTANPDGTVTFESLRSFIGSSEVTYYVEDTAGVAYETTVTITTEPGPFVVLAFTGAELEREAMAAGLMLALGLLALGFGLRRRRGQAG